MAKDIYWTKIIINTFLEESGLRDRIKLGDEKARILEGILRTRIAGWTITKQAQEFHCAESTISKYIKEVLELYDETQKYSKVLPVRIKDAKSELAQSGGKPIDEAIQEYERRENIEKL